MPFLSRDWRGPGEDWVKCENGWETKKMAMMDVRRKEARELVKRRRTKTEGDENLEDNKENVDKDLVSSKLERYSSLPVLQPFSPITIKITKEVAGFNSLTDVLKRLDFLSAVHDVRRFQYVAVFLRLLLTPEKIYQLPGGSQKLICRILEEMACTVFAEHRNEHVLRDLLNQLHTSLDNRPVWGTQLGCESLLVGQNNARRKIACISALERRKEEMVYKEEGVMKMDKLPEECVREILCRLGHNTDIDRAGQAMQTMGMIVKEKRIWRELVQAHFTTDEVEFVMKKRPQLKEKKDCRDLYMAVKKQFGLRQQFTELLMLCKTCRVLYWESYGHPCYWDNPTCSPPIPITPTTFLTFFSV